MKKVKGTLNYAEVSDEMCSKAADALMASFEWRASEEGAKYWSGVYSKLREKEYRAKQAKRAAPSV